MAAVAAWTYQSAAMRMWHRFLAHIAQRPNDTELRIGAIRIGASCLLAGSLSVAIQVVCEFRPFMSWSNDGDALIQLCIDRIERFPGSDFGGGYLGWDSASAVREFGEFFSRVDAAIQ
jgi:hypothetical protein